MDPRFLCVGTQLWLMFLKVLTALRLFGQYMHSILNSTPLIAFFPRTFNPADYAEPAQTEENYGGGSTWNNTGSMELEEGASKLIY